MTEQTTTADDDSINTFENYQTIADVAKACDADENLVEYLRLVDILATPEITGCGTKGAELRFGATVPSVVINRLDDFGLECDGLYVNSDGNAVFNVLVDEDADANAEGGDA